MEDIYNIELCLASDICINVHNLWINLRLEEEF